MEVRALDPPGICFLCETTPQQDSVRVINTNRHFNPGGPTHLSGRKYICEPCAKELGYTMDLVERADFARVVDELNTANRVNEEQAARIADLTKFHELAARLIPKKPKPAPAKPAAKKES